MLASWNDGVRLSERSLQPPMEYRQLPRLSVDHRDVKAMTPIARREIILQIAPVAPANSVGAL
ncbi:hypothetical protein FJD34_03625 [Pseudomonas brenneri]|uniref:Uncharacterized protein n=1 Tax=Pseudomonas brenneri TaxID=129817 RepID=A0A5B2URZ5_9PSED|nr:hypothetical protein F1720_14010 [Pseudomonas brenneri]TWR80959.1 hypothetical protein FJD34_03625 [Pseudomonas brenneri]